MDDLKVLKSYRSHHLGEMHWVNVDGRVVNMSAMDLLVEKLVRNARVDYSGELSPCCDEPFSDTYARYCMRCGGYE